MSDPDRMTDLCPTPDLITLVGVRDISFSEPDDDIQWQEGLIKRLSDGEPVKMRRISGDWILIEPDFSLGAPNATDDGPRDPSQ